MQSTYENFIELFCYRICSRKSKLTETFTRRWMGLDENYWARWPVKMMPLCSNVVSTRWTKDGIISKQRVWPLGEYIVFFLFFQIHWSIRKETWRILTIELYRFVICPSTIHQCIPCFAFIVFSPFTRISKRDLSF